MKTISLMLIFVASVLISPFAIASMQIQSNDNTTQNGQVQNNVNRTTQNQADSATLGWLVVLNKSEIAVANEVLSRNNLNPLVKGYAQYLLTQHNQLLKDTMQLSQKLKMTPNETAENAAALQKEEEEGLNKLKSIEDVNEFQKAFIDAMVQGHMEASTALKGYINDEKNSKVKALLKLTEKHILRHLEKAKVIQKKIGK